MILGRCLRNMKRQAQENFNAKWQAIYPWLKHDIQKGMVHAGVTLR